MFSSPIDVCSSLIDVDFGVPFRYLISNSRDFLVRQTKIKTADSFLYGNRRSVLGVDPENERMK